MKNRLKCCVVAASFLLSLQYLDAQTAALRWPAQKAEDWYRTKGWLRGSDFIVSTAVNQLEMWQAESFDSKNIDRELGYAQAIGLNCMRVFLHHLAWQEDPAGFKYRMGRYLSIAHKHGISTIFVFLTTAGTSRTMPESSPRPRRAYITRGGSGIPAGYITTNRCWPIRWNGT